MFSIASTAIEEERTNSIRQEDQVAFIARAIFLFSLMLFSCLFLLLILYLAKSAMGIDLIPGFSMGIWQWFEESVVTNSDVFIRSIHQL